MFDVFYWGNKPDLFAFEKPAQDLDDAARQAKTSHYWFIYGGNDYTGFDFDITPAPWEAHQIYVYPSQWQQDGGVYLANVNTVDDRIWNFRTEQTVTRLADRTLWTIPANIDADAFDYSWHPDDTDMPYIYEFNTQHQKNGGPKYIVENATETKYMISDKVRALSTKDNWKRMPKEMLYARCLAKGANRIGADLLLGLYTAEEMADTFITNENQIKRNEDGTIAEVIDVGPTFLRLVTHRDLSDTDVDTAASVIASLL